MFVPEWFINSLVYENDKQIALSGKIKGTSLVRVKCANCLKEYDVIVNSCVKTRNKNIKDHRLLCRSCSLLKSDIFIGARFGNLNVISGVSENNKVKCRCSCGNFVDVFVNNLRSGRTKSCGNHKHYELDELMYKKSMTEFESFLKSLNINYFKTEYCDLFDCNIDFIIPNNNEKIFVNFYGEYSLRSNKLPPKKMFELSNENRIINIFVNEYLNNTEKLNSVFKDIVITPHKIYARKCIVKEVPVYEACEFYNINHIQGATHASKINYGLYYNDELYAVMGFGSSNYHSMKNAFSNDYFDSSRYELHRYAVKLGYSIIGGCSKLLKHFEREYSPSYLLSYSSNDWFTGNMYKTLGFTFSCYTPSRYYWVKDGVVLNREKCQLKRLQKDYPDLLSEAFLNNAKNKEVYVMKKLGYSKITSSGTKKWEKFYLEK